MSKTKVTGKIHHIEIYVKDINTSRQFWSWFLKELGYSEFQSWECGFSMLLGDTYIVFVQTEDKYNNVDFHRCKSGLNHIAFHVDQVEIIEEIKNKLISRDIKLLYMDKYPHVSGENSYKLFFEDTDRLKVELCCNIQ